MGTTVKALGHPEKSAIFLRAIAEQAVKLIFLYLIVTRQMVARALRVYISVRRHSAANHLVVYASFLLKRASFRMILSIESA